MNSADSPFTVANVTNGIKNNATSTQRATQNKKTQEESQEQEKLKKKEEALKAKQEQDEKERLKAEEKLKHKQEQEKLEKEEEERQEAEEQKTIEFAKKEKERQEKREELNNKYPTITPKTSEQTKSLFRRILDRILWVITFTIYNPYKESKSENISPTNNQAFSQPESQSNDNTMANQYDNAKISKINSTVNYNTNQLLNNQYQKL